MVRELEVQGRHLVIAEADHLDNEAGAVVWDAALVLVQYIGLHSGSHIAGKRVLELGCGPGAVGCAAAALGAASVTLTDLPHLLPLVQQNIEANSLQHIATSAALPWGQPADHLHPPFDLVLASDVLYQAEALPLFVHTLAAVCGAATATLLCVERRPTLPFPRNLFQQAGFEVWQVPLAEQHPHWRSEDIELFSIRRA